MKFPSVRFPVRFLFPSLLSAALLTGCATRPDPEEEARQRALQQQRQQQQRQYMDDQYRRTSAGLESVNTEVYQLRQEIDGVERKIGAEHSQEIARIQGQLNELEERLNRMDAQRQADKKEIIDTLNANMKKLVGQLRPAQPAGRTHVVASGETLSAIAGAYRVSMRAIMQANNITRPDNLRVGQRLIIP